ncbi:MAG: hypothetical protein ACLU99_07580 [Alphaproteobacteria bacterium]
MQCWPMRLSLIVTITVKSGFGTISVLFGRRCPGVETLTALVILCIVPGWFMPIAIILGCWCLVKALMVVTAAYYNFVIAAKGKN